MPDHHPPHINVDDMWYFLTASTHNRSRLLVGDNAKQGVRDTIRELDPLFDFELRAWVVLDNHYHLLIQTPDGNLSKGMRQLNGVTTQTSNRRHHRVGHLFQGRFKAILVDHNAYLLELSRYIVLNPVRAGMVKTPGDWPWSSYRASAGLAPVAPWLTVDGVLSQFVKRRSLAQQRYAQFVSEGIRADSPWQNLKGQVFLGDDRFVQQMQAKIESRQRNDVQIPAAQRRPRALSLPIIERSAPDRNAAIMTAYATGAYSYQEISTHFGIHFTTVGRIVRRGE